MLTEPIKNRGDIETLKEYFLQKGNVRDYTLFSMGINSGINVNDLIALKWSDVYDTQSGEFLPSINIKNKKNCKEKHIALNENCKNALSRLFKESQKNFLPESYIFASKNGGHITRIRAFQIIKKASENCGIKGNISCQSMKKTLAYYAYTVMPNL